MHIRNNIWVKQGKTGGQVQCFTKNKGHVLRNRGKQRDTLKQETEAGNKKQGTGLNKKQGDRFKKQGDRFDVLIIEIETTNLSPCFTCPPVLPLF